MENEIVRLLISLRPQALIIAGCTLAAYAVMSLLVNRLNARGRAYRYAGLFVGLGFRSTLHLSISWIKLIFFASTLCLSGAVKQIHYVSLIVLTAAACAVSLNVKKILMEIFDGVFMAAGFWINESIIRYLQQIKFDVGICVLRWLLIVLVIFCAVAFFLKEVMFVSEERKHFDENGEIE